MKDGCKLLNSLEKACANKGQISTLLLSQGAKKLAPICSPRRSTIPSISHM
jgi:hypothetical protein